MKIPAQRVVIGGRYVLERPLSSGGMGSVWIAWHRELEVRVAMKFMMPELVQQTDMRLRFEREAKSAARLSSQYIVKMLDYGVDDGLPYMAMELLEGESLADKLSRERRLSLPVTTQILIQIGKALRTAHEAGLVHRDLKPGNIFLAVKDGEHVVKVLDFGIVRDTSTNSADEARGVTATGVTMGSVHYMSPEQIRGARHADARSDLWSIAVILYKMLTGNVPFPGTAHGDVMVRVCTESVAPPSFVVPTLPKSVDAFFMRALTKDPAGRFQSMSEMVDAFVAATQSGANELLSSDNAPTAPLPRASMQSISAFGSSIQPQPAMNGQSGTSANASFVSAVLDTAPGTFQAVTMQPEPPASPSQKQGRAARHRQRTLTLMLMAAAAFAALAGYVVVVIMAAPQTVATAQAKKAVASAVANLPNVSTTPSASVSAVATAAPEKAIPSASAMTPITPPVVTPGVLKAPPRSTNPLDIAD